MLTVQYLINILVGSQEPRIILIRDFGK